MRSKISRHSVIAGKSADARAEAFRRLIRRLSGSLTVKLIILVGIFAALPFILYGQFEKADRQMRTLLTGSIQHRSWLIAQALTPLLSQSGGLSYGRLNDILARFAQDRTILRLMYRPDKGGAAERFYFVASAPPIPSDGLSAELDSLERHGILESLSNSCTLGAPVEFRYDQPNGVEELLTSVVPITSSSGCWVLISTHNGSEFLKTSIGRPYWKTPDVRVAAIVYLTFAVLASLLALSVRRSLRHFRAVAREIRRGGMTNATFVSRNIVPELASVAGDFDYLVRDLRRVAADIRETAEDNAHAVKTPLATIRSALEPIKRAMATTDQRAQRAVQLIESSLARLNVLVSTAQRLGNDTADFIEAPKLPLNFTMIVLDVIQNLRDLALEKNINIVHRLAVDLCVLAPEGVLDVIVENILDNAITFTRPGGVITVTLSKAEGRADLYIDDQGPGIDPAKIGQVFERYVSMRRAENGCPMTESPSHAGLGLWIVRRHVEALGGVVAVSNRASGGLSVNILLPANGN